MDVPHLRLAPALADSARPAASQGTIRVLLADDHTLMRRTLRRLLEDEKDLEVVAEAGELTSLVRNVDAHQPHVLVLDLGLCEEGSGSEAIRQLRERAPDTQIVIVTMQENPIFAERALAAGAIGFVLKERADEELSEAIRRAARGERYISTQLAVPLGDMHRAVAEDDLTVRENEVLRLTALGYTSVEMARKLHLSPRTVEKHRARIHRKLGRATRAELVSYALRRGLLRA